MFPVDLNCGATVAENMTYFSSTGQEGNGICGITLCKSHTDVCQMRLDFNTFVIQGPSTETLVADQIKLLSGVANAAGTGFIFGNCVNDRFYTTNPGGRSPPTICGTNTDEHSKFAFVECPFKEVVTVKVAYS